MYIPIIEFKKYGSFHHLKAFIYFCEVVTSISNPHFHVYWFFQLLSKLLNKCGFWGKQVQNIYYSLLSTYELMGKLPVSIRY